MTIAGDFCTTFQARRKQPFQLWPIAEHSSDRTGFTTAPLRSSSGSADK
jgi:hypothetical protein